MLNHTLSLGIGDKAGDASDQMVAPFQRNAWWCSQRAQAICHTGLRHAPSERLIGTISLKAWWMDDEKVKEWVSDKITRPEDCTSLSFADMFWMSPLPWHPQLWRSGQRALRDVLIPGGHLVILTTPDRFPDENVVCPYSKTAPILVLFSKDNNVTAICRNNKVFPQERSWRKVLRKADSAGEFRRRDVCTYTLYGYEIMNNAPALL